MAGRLPLGLTLSAGAISLLASSCVRSSYITYGRAKDEILVAECGYSLFCVDLKDSLYLIINLGDQSRLFKHVDTCLGVQATIEAVEAEFRETTVVPDIRLWKSDPKSLIYTISHPDWEEEFRRNGNLLVKVTLVRNGKGSIEEVPLHRFKHGPSIVFRKIVF